MCVRYNNYKTTAWQIQIETWLRAALTWSWLCHHHEVKATVWKTPTLDSKVKTLHIQEKLNSNRNKNCTTKTNISILPYVSQVFILWCKTKEMGKMHKQKYVVKESNNEKNFMTLVVILKILEHTVTVTLKVDVFRPSCWEVWGTLSATSRVEGTDEHVWELTLGRECTSTLTTL